ncbi:hypothetical protein OAS39_13380 [Pirellulales bacterium]|nr:hypothetical protein [Pirellulales bacterium]
MPFYFFIWTSEIVEHFAEHDVLPDEFEDVVSNPDYEDVSRTTGNPVAFGSTNEGRHLCCVFKRHDDDVIEPITAYDIQE